MNPDAVESMQKNVDRHGKEIFASYGLIGAVAMFSGLGYLADRYLDTGHYLLLTGTIIGLVVGFGQLARALRH